MLKWSQNLIGMRERGISLLSSSTLRSENKSKPSCKKLASLSIMLPTRLFGTAIQAITFM